MEQLQRCKIETRRTNRYCTQNICDKTSTEGRNRDVWKILL